MRVLIALLCGLLFGLGLTISAMIDPAKVLAFLDVGGDWDPSLAFVMISAIPVAAIGFAIGRKRATPVCAPAFVGPTKTAIDGKLLGGAALFGLGWGLVGFCPGPALAGLGFLGWKQGLFLAAMLFGMLVVNVATGRRCGPLKPIGDWLKANVAAARPTRGA